MPLTSSPVGKLVFRCLMIIFAYMTEMRTYDMLSSYAISEQGRVIELDVMDNAQLTPQNNYKLLTDEEVYLETKGYSIKLWRRFTVDDIIKMWNSPKAKPFDQSPSRSIAIINEIVQVGTSSDNDTGQVDNLGQVDGTSGTTKRGTSAQVVINGTTYKSINEASAQLSINRKVIKKRLDDSLNTDYTYLED